MKKLYSLVLAATLSSALFALDVFTFVPVEGNINSYVQTNFSITSKFGNYFRTPKEKINHTLNANRLESETKVFSTKDELLNKTTYKYDANNNLIEQCYYEKESTLLWKSISTYKNNLKTETSEYDKKGNLKTKIIYTYTDGKLTDESDYNSEGTLGFKIIYKYNKNGNVEKEILYNASGALETEKTYTYTAKNKIESITTFDNYTKNSIIHVFRYTNDALTEITTYDNNQNITNRIIIKYDTNGNVAKISEYDVAEKFGEIQNELVNISEYVYQ